MDMTCEVNRIPVRMKNNYGTCWILFRLDGDPLYREVMFPVKEYPDSVAALAGFLRGEGEHDENYGKGYDSVIQWEDTFDLDRSESWSIEF